MSAADTARSVLEIVRDLRETTGHMLDAAKKVDVMRLQALAERRAEILFELEVTLANDPEKPEQPELLLVEHTELRDLERRLARVGSLVVRAIAKAAPGPAETYGRAGRVTGA